MNKLNENTDLLRRQLRSYGGRDIEYFDEISSTNTYLTDMAKRRSPDHRDRALVVAGSQTQGKGRLGRTFVSPPESGIYMSVLFTGSEECLRAECALILTVIAGVAVAETLNEYSAGGFHIKWVNDVLHGDKKICGILAETKIMEYSYTEYVVLGIGINMLKSGHPAEIKNIAVSLEEVIAKEVCGEIVSNEVIIASVLEKIDSMWDEYLKSHDSGAIINRYRGNFKLVGRKVNVFSSPQSTDFYEATVRGIDDSASLIVTDGDGTEHTLTSGEISIRLKP